RSSASSRSGESRCLLRSGKTASASETTNTWRRTDMTLTTGQKFIELFTGRADAHGLGIGRIEKHPDHAIPVELYQLHLKGEGSGLGVFPLRADGTVLFAAIDLDEPDFKLAETLQSMLPGQTWIERSRSGNAHVWAFFTEP